MGSLEQQTGSVGYDGRRSELSLLPPLPQSQPQAHLLYSQQSFLSNNSSFHVRSVEEGQIFDELPKVTIVSVSTPDPGDIIPALLSYTIEVQYKQFKWRLFKKAAHVFYLHFSLKKRAFMAEVHEKQEQVKEWLQNLGIVDHTPVLQNDDILDDEECPLNQEEIVKNRDVPSRAAFPVMRPALGNHTAISERAKEIMQQYLNNFFGDMDFVNSREVCKFLEVSKLSFCSEYGPKLKEDYVMVRHLPAIPSRKQSRRCCSNCCLNCFTDNWQKVWAVLKPGFLALLDDPFDSKPLDIIVFDVLPMSNENENLSLATEAKERNPLRHAFLVTCGNQNIKFRVKDGGKAKRWIAAINEAGLRPLEGWCHPHRFGSFAPVRGLSDDGSKAQWFIDGKAAFEAIALSIESAKSEIFICGWWLCPELYLRRPFNNHAESRLDVLLEAKAKEGVQIYILLYKEVALALKINSVYSKRKLLSIHENVRVLRYPDHFSAGVYLWSHHEKLVIVDNHICYIGGLDLCFGRYDTRDHRVGDCPPAEWPGKDYYNPRESEPNSWEDSLKDELDRSKYPRMPWHDVHCALWGPPCRDIARHFVQRWNFAKRNKAPYEETIPLLMPQHHMVIPHYLGKATEFELETEETEDEYMKRQDSISSTSSAQDIPLLLPQEAGIHNSSETSSKTLWNLSPISSPADTTNFDVPMKGFVDDIPLRISASLLHWPIINNSDTEWWDSQERGDLVCYGDETGQAGPPTSCRCQVIRSVSQWSAGTSQVEESIHFAYCSLIEKAEHYIYIENQFFISGLAGDDVIRNRVIEALYRRIMKAYHDKKTFRVIIVIPLLPGFQGGVDDSGAASVRAIMHWQYRTICRGQNSLLHNLHALLGPQTHEYISFYGLRSHGRLVQNGRIATSQVYVHSKIMLVDDRCALIGSANINDRSLLGSRDSEIGVLIEDKEFLSSFMNEKPWKAGKFTLSLRLSLWAEHLGLRSLEIGNIMDPVSASTYRDLWMATATENSVIYQEVFSCIPNNVILTRIELRQSVAFWKEKDGYTTIDLGLAPENSGDDKLGCVRGHLVLFPLDFMSKEDLRPVFNQSEYYAAHIFY